MIGSVNTLQGPPEALAERIRGELAAADAGTQAYLRLGARLDLVTAVCVEPGGLAWQARHAAWNHPWVTGMGTHPGAVARSARQLADIDPAPSGITVQRQAFGALSPDFRPVAHWEWDWWYTTRAPADRPGAARVTGLALTDTRVPALLRAAHPDAMVQPGDPRIVGWYGITMGSLGSAARTPDKLSSGELSPDDLVAVAAVTTMRPGVAHLGSVATHPRWRGRGLSRDLCTRLTRDALASGSPAVTLGMHAANRSARAVYSSLGYQIGYRWASGRLA